MRKSSLFTLMAAMLLLAAGCSKDDKEPSFSSVEGGWFAQRMDNGVFAQVRHSIFLNGNGVGKVYRFTSATDKYRYDAAYSQTGDTLTIDYQEVIRVSGNWDTSNVTLKLGVNENLSSAYGRWFSSYKGVSKKFGQVYMNQDAEMSETKITGNFTNIPQ
ncbi:hypothetical protein [Gynurincola endophyticus]|uniref:hypothetical protein n=1 Tax=Gynurincola endophyticus TaxID=2479004 RepID=UPI000F8C84EA|nr:hypothetical protein [Gynurincola endophyticus]